MKIWLRDIVKKFFTILIIWILHKAGMQELPEATITGVDESVNVSFPTFEKDLVEPFGFKIIKFRTDWGLISGLYDEWIGSNEQDG